MRRIGSAMVRTLGAAIALVTSAYAQAPYGAPGMNPPPYGQQPPLNQQQGNQPPFNQPRNQQDDADSANHGVARLSLVNGNVSVRRGDSGELVAATVNAPLMATDRLVTGDNARAELQFDYSNMVRLAPSSEVRIGDLAYHHYLVQIAQGMVTFRVLRDSDAQVEISTPSVSVRPVRSGVYRILVGVDGITQITVRAGEATIFSPSGSEPLRAGQTMLSRGTADNPEFQTIAAIPSDDWDRWNADRDGQLMRAADQGYRHVSPDITGTEDLNGYGQWQNDPQYGNVWVPQVAPDWAPYRDGRWVWEDYYGWTWVSYDPWGWAPYHYGRWYHGGFGWAWYPGPMGDPYYWSPALVGFFGWGPGFGLGFGFGNIGWVPLAPFEVFRPWYGRGFVGGGRNFSVISNANIAGVYRNAAFANSVTGMRSGEFGRASVSSTNFVRASSADLQRASAVRGQLPISASSQSRQFSNGAANLQGMPRSSANTRFFSSPGFAAGRTSAQSAGRSFTNGAGNSAASGNSTGGWRRFDPTGRDAVQGGRSNTGQGIAGNGRGVSQGSSQRSNPGAGQGTNGGGWRTIQGANTPSRGSGSPGASGYQGGSGGSASQSRSFGGSQPVRISPSIVRERSASGGGSTAPRSNNFGGTRPSAPSGGGGGFHGSSGSHSSGGSHGGHR